MAVRIRPVADDADVERFHDVAVRCDPLDHPHQLAPPLGEVRSMARSTSATDRPVLLLADADGELLGTALLWLPLRDNTDKAHLYVRVLPEHRGRGHGRAIVEAAVDTARAHGRTRLTCHVSDLATGAPARRIAERLGGAPALATIRAGLRVRELPDETLDRLVVEKVGDAAAGYEMVEWVDRVSDELLEDTAYLMSRMSTDVPRGKLDAEPEVWDGARYRAKEAEAIEGGRLRLVAGAVEASSGRLVAYTDIGIATAQPEIAEQWDTIVDPVHRGRRLGLAIKVANLRQLRRRSPATEWVQTFNADANAPMRAVNEQLGFEVLERYVAWQIPI